METQVLSMEYGNARNCCTWRLLTAPTTEEIIIHVLIGIMMSLNNNQQWNHQKMRRGV
jgi:hypothetical protein